MIMKEGGVTYTEITNEENNEENFTLPDELVKLSINDRLFLETLVMMIRGNSIQYSSGKKRRNNRKKLD